ncbi:MAG: histidinol-phosphate transaminase [Clostridia bacterium]|nr:histidinol-phosphate transaminase [Clostridia bacterium]
MSRFLAQKYSALKPYTPGEQPRDMQYVKLNTNESPFEPSPKVIEAVNAQVSSQNLYPDPTKKALCEAIAENRGVKSENVTVSNGSDELLAFTFMALCPHGICFPDISYGFYPVYAQTMGVDALQIPLHEDFSIKAEDYFNANRTVLIANPNAPTGMALCRDDIEKIVLHNQNELVVIDEAYVDFGAESAVCLTKKYDNLLVIGTYSKSRSLAGARIGYAVGNEEIIADLNRMIYSFNPYNVNRLALAAGTAATKDAEYFEKCTVKICAARAWTKEQLEKMGFTVLPSYANFVFAKKDGISGETMYLKLKEKGVLVRYFSGERVSDYVRITIGTQEQMQVLVEKIAEIITEELL